VPHKDACLLTDEQARQTLGLCFILFGAKIAIKFQIPKENNKKCRNPQRFFIEKRQDSQRNTSHICQKSQYVTIKFSRLTEYAFPPSMCEGDG